MKVDGAGDIYNIMVNRGTKHMLLFLNYVLGKVDKMNLEFQPEYYMLGTLYATIVDAYKSLLGMFVREEVVLCKTLANIDNCDSSQYKSLVLRWAVSGTAKERTSFR